MDIATGLKKFMDTMGIQNSQFADTCGIPRPSLSQLLNGRNKKVSNEVIEKIHRAYPGLSISWLMFGEGNMLTDENIEISEPQNERDLPDSPSLFVDNKTIDDSQSEFAFEHEKNSENLMAERTAPQAVFPVENPSYPDGAHAASVSLNMNKARKVVSIMVFYSDSSFETFVPKV